MPIKEKLKKAGVYAGVIGATAIGEAGIGAASGVSASAPIIGAVLGGAGGVIAAKELISEARLEKNKCLKSFVDWLGMKDLAVVYSHECKRHTSKSKEEIKSKPFGMVLSGKARDPCKELQDVNQEVADMEAAWRKECSCGKLEGVV